MKNKNAVLIVSVLIITSVIAGYFLGRSSVKLPKSKHTVTVKLEKGKIKIDTIIKPVPYTVRVLDSVPVFVSTDTAALYEIWKEFHKEKKYVLNFSNDSDGVFRVDATVRENKLISAVSFIQPNIRSVYQKEIVYKVPTLQPWIMLGSSIDFKTSKIQIGLDFKNKYLVGASAIRFDDKNSYTIDLGVKF